MTGMNRHWKNAGDRAEELRGLGRWDEFVEERGRLIKEGKKAGVADKEAEKWIWERMHPAGSEGADELPGVVGGEVEILHGDEARLAGLELAAAGVKAVGNVGDQLRGGAVVGKAFEGRKGRASAKEAVEWVFENMSVVDVKAEEAPSSGAWGYLQMCRRDPSVRSDFYKSVWPKLLPTRGQLDEMFERLGGGERDPAEEFVARVKRMYEEAMTPKAGQA